MEGARKPLVGYYRLSKDSQFEGRAHLNQIAVVERFTRSRNGELIASFLERMSGRVEWRPGLEAALDTCRERNATLVVAQLDRLTRSVKLYARLAEADVPFVIAGLPTATPFVMAILATIAEEELRLLGDRVRAGYERKKREAIAKHGIYLHGLSTLPRSEFLHLHRQAVAASRDMKLRFREKMRPHVEGIVARGITSCPEIAKELNFLEFKTFWGRKWSKNNVQLFLSRLGMRPWQK